MSWPCELIFQFPLRFHFTTTSPRELIFLLHVVVASRRLCHHRSFCVFTHPPCQSPTSLFHRHHRIQPCLNLLTPRRCCRRRHSSPESRRRYLWSLSATPPIRWRFRKTFSHSQVASGFQTRHLTSTVFQKRVAYPDVPPPKLHAYATSCAATTVSSSRHSLEKLPPLSPECHRDRFFPIALPFFGRPLFSPSLAAFPVIVVAIRYPCCRRCWSIPVAVHKIDELGAVCFRSTAESWLTKLVWLGSIYNTPAKFNQLNCIASPTDRLRCSVRSRQIFS